MSLIHDRAREHPVWRILDEYGRMLAAVQTETLTQEDTDFVARLRAVQTLVGKRLAGVDAYFLLTPALDRLQALLSTCHTSVAAYTDGLNSSHLRSANGQSDEILSVLAGLPVPASTEEALSSREASETYRQRLEASLSELTQAKAALTEQVTALEQQIASLTSAVASERQHLESLASTQQADFSSAQEARSRAFDQARMDEQEKVSRLLSEHAAATAAQATELRSTHDLLTKTHEERLASLEADFVAGTALIRDEVVARKREVEALVGVIGNLGVTSGYLTEANAARRAVRFWHTITVAAMCGFIFMAYSAFLPTLSGGFSWSAFAGRVFVSLTVGVLAAYGASQADRYMQLERRNRRLALELEAIGPFLAPLSPEKREEFRLTVGDRTFARPDASEGEPLPKSPASVADLAKSKDLQGFITDLVKAARG